MHETDEERERRLRQIGGGSEIWNDSGWLMPRLIFQYPELTNPCFELGAEIMMTSSQQRTLGDNPLIKFTKYKFNFNGKR